LIVDWPHIVRTHSPLVWRTAYRLLGDQADAADCLQETFISALEVTRRDEVHNWPCLLQRIATFRAVDRLRQRHRQYRGRETVPHFSEVPAANPGPVEASEAMELIAQLRRVMADQPAQQAAAFALRELDGLSYSDIAEQLGIEVNAVGVLLHRARQRLRELLASAGVSPGK